ncbi:MAG TPA: SLBB domain-containing protein [Rhizomicrobium sp.]|nr:SLBB domain-containing protein [Rhizomicrobium sp.]
MVRRRALRAVSLLCLVAGIGLNTAAAQTLGTSDIQSILQSVQAGQTGSTSSTTPPPTAPVTPSTQTFTPATQPTTTPPTASAAASAPSGLETQFSARAGVPLKQFGYDVFGTAATVTASQVGAAQDSYVLGVGDQVQIIMVGHENATYTVTIDRDGRLLLLNLPPIAAAGRTLGEVRAELSARIAAQFLNTKSFISLTTVRQISVLVTGEVYQPGMRTLTALNTALDALVLSGGIKKTGSLRGVYIIRGDKRIPLDIYSIINYGGRSRLGALTEGDRIVVPPIGKTVAITGSVPHPGIFELSPGASRISATALVALAGGPQIAGAVRYTRMALLPDGRTQMGAIPKEGVIANGEVLFVDMNRSVVKGRVTLAGDVAVPGVHALTASSTVSGLIRDPDDLNGDAYTLFAVIVRHDPDTNFLKIVPFSIANVFNHKENPKLVEDDLIYVFSTTEVTNLASAAATALYKASQAPGVAALLQQQQQSTIVPAGQTGASVIGTTGGSNGGAATSSAAAPSAPQLAQMAQVASNLPTVTTAPGGGSGGAAATQATTSTATLLGGGGDSSTASSLTPTQFPPPINTLAQNLGVTPSAIVNMASDYLVWVNGEVLNPGPLLAQSGTSLTAILDAAGGLQRQADLSAIAVTSTEIDVERGTSRTLRNIFSQRETDFTKVSLRPFDSINVRPVFSDRVGESITLSGQVRYPGTYEITRDEKLSSVIARAGGLTDEAYPYGAVFTRQSAAVAEAAANQRAAMMLNSAIATASTQVSTLTAAPNLTYVATLVQTIMHQPVIGRISVTVDPAVLLTHPERDPLLETGDAIYIPKRPYTVAVTGEVLNPGAFAYKPNMSLDDYIDLAGGDTDAAEDSMIFIIMPDGTAVPSSGSWWSFGGGTHIPPGATIVVPRDPQPFNLTTFLGNYTDILSKIAITAASLAVLQKNN